MRPQLRGISGLIFVVILALPLSVGAQETRVVTGVVVDAESGAPVSDALLTIPGTGLSVVTDPEGGFEVSGVPVGSQQLVLRHLAYGEHAQALMVGESGALDFRIVVSSRAIELMPLEVEVASREAQAQRASGTVTNVIDRATIEAFPPGGQGLLPLLQARIPGLRVDGGCVEFRRMQYRVASDETNPEVVVIVPCRDITVYVDGVPNREGSFLLRQLFLHDVERIEVLSPGEAGARYDTPGRGVILVETRRGVVTDARDRIHVNGFGWDEPEPYPWLRVVGLSALGTAAVAGLTSRAVFDCAGRPEERAAPLRCHAAAGVPGALLTSAIGRVITHGAGRSRYTEGRTFPALLMGMATASIGYTLYLHGENQDSDASRTAGQIVLAVGIPITLTLADRAFRMVR